MDGDVALVSICGNNERVITRRTKMAQDRWPHKTTSVSGISAEIWDIFKITATRKGLNYREAMERAIAELKADIRSGKQIAWEPSRSAPSRPIKIHEATQREVRELSNQIGYRQNVVFITAMLRWVRNQKPLGRTDVGKS